ncbi:C40 family peptidase [Patescibacteria group bacterium]|nr:C40 family peptidase [Patescibacteria group bacterium]
MKNRDIADIWNKYYLDAPYKVGCQSREEGYDCVSLVFTFYEKLGIDIEQYGKINRKNYLQYWDGSVEDTELLKIWAESLGEKINKAYRSAGDLLVCYFEKNKQWFLSIYLGNELCSFIIFLVHIIFDYLNWIS